MYIDLAQKIFIIKYYNKLFNIRNCKFANHW